LLSNKTIFAVWLDNTYVVNYYADNGKVIRNKILINGEVKTAEGRWWVEKNGLQAQQFADFFDNKILYGQFYKVPGGYIPTAANQDDVLFDGFEGFIADNAIIPGNDSVAVIQQVLGYLENSVN
jgi:hypothetical protein